jgi:protease I
VEIFGVTSGALRAKRIAILAADGFEYIELILPKHALWWARAKVDVISLHAGRIRGMNLTEPTRTVRVDRSLDDADPELYDGLFIPGGFVGPDFLRQSQRAHAFVRAFERARKPIATICHGPWLLVSADLVHGRALAAWPGIRADIVHAGGMWRDQPLVRDGNWLSSRGPQDLREFVPAMVAFFSGTLSEGVGKQDTGSTSSPAPLEPFPVAVGAARLMPGPAILTLAAASLGTGLFGALRRATSRS